MTATETTTVPVDLDAPTSSGDRCNPTNRNEVKGTNIMTQHADTTPDDPFEPIELDPPSPAVMRWNELADNDIEIEHGGDASKVIGFPRPAWSEPDNDIVGGTTTSSYYRSAYVEVASLTGGGEDDGTYLQPAHLRVSTRVHGNGMPVIGILVRRFVDDQWLEFGTSMPPETALQLADVICAAVDLLNDTTTSGGDQ